MPLNHEVPCLKEDGFSSDPPEKEHTYLRLLGRTLPLYHGSTTTQSFLLFLYYTNLWNIVPCIGTHSTLAFHILLFYGPRLLCVFVCVCVGGGGYVIDQYK